MSAFFKAKYLLRLHGVSGLSRLWYGLGGGPGLVRRFPRLGSEALIAQIASIPLPEPVPNLRPLKVAFLTM